MRREPRWSASTTLEYSAVRSSRLTELSCRKCRVILDIIQPSTNHPDKFLAVCPVCDSWYRVETRSGDPRGVMVSLPDVSVTFPMGNIIPKHSGLEEGKAFRPD